jgi:hypothetical protein
MFKRINRLGIVMVTVFSLLGLVGCKHEHKVYENGFFQYTLTIPTSRRTNPLEKLRLSALRSQERSKE